MQRRLSVSPTYAPFVRICSAVLAIAIALGVAIAYVVSAREPGRAGPLTSPVDFNAFYCAGSVLWNGADPYRAEPLGACERAAYAESKLHAYVGEVVPAPLPPVILSAFGVFRGIGFRNAALVWFGILVAATVLTVAVVIRLSGLRGALPATLVVVAVIVPSILVGQVAPVGIAALALAAFLLERGNDRAAAVALGVATCVPQLAVPAMLATAIFRARARVPLVAVSAALVLGSLACGIALNVEYVARVLPLHALAEGTDYASQFGLPALAAALGVPVTTSLALGIFSYLTMSAIGVMAAGGLAVRFRSAAMLALVPPVFAVTFGEYVHVHQVVVAVAFAVVLATRGPRRLRAWALVAAVALALPLQTLAEGLASDVRANVPDPTPALLAADRPDAFAEDVNVVWTRFKAARDPRTPLEQTLTKIPDWLALVFLVGSASVLGGPSLGAAFARERRLRPVVLRERVSSAAP